MPKTKITRKLQLGRKLLTLKLYNAITWLPTNLFSEAKRMALQSQFRVWWGYQTLDLVKLNQHLTQTFEGHEQSGKHANSIKWNRC